jgi:hypothetical protein
VLQAKEAVVGHTDTDGSGIESLKDLLLRMKLSPALMGLRRRRGSEDIVVVHRIQLTYIRGRVVAGLKLGSLVLKISLNTVSSPGMPLSMLLNLASPLSATQAIIIAVGHMRNGPSQLQRSLRLIRKAW